MCLPFHLYACSKPSLFWFQVIKINWTFNLISKPCPFLCLSRVGDGQLISKGELKVFLHFSPDSNPLLLSERTGNNGTRDQQHFFFTPVKHCDVEQWFSLLVTHWNHVRVFQNPCVQAPPQTIFYQTLSR